jgi:hypothetical protein
VEHCVRYGFDNVYGFQILSHLILFFADGFPPIFMLLLRWISTIFILLLRWISTNFSAITEMDFHQFLCYYWDGYPPIFRLLLRWISTKFYASTEMDFHQFCCYYCGVGFDSFQNVLDHTCDFHGNMVLKVKSLELIITTGKFW